MSKGSKVIPFRIPSSMEQEVEHAIIMRNRVTKDAPWTRTDFILAAIREKLGHMRRSRLKRGRGAKS